MRLQFELETQLYMKASFLLNEERINIYCRTR